MKSKKKLVVTGGAGFIGSNFIRHFIQKNEDYEILNLDKLTYAGNLANTEDFARLKNYQFVKGDIADKKTVFECLRAAEAVINFAAETHVDRSIHGAEVFLKTDILGVYNLLEAVRKFNIKKFVQISTDEVYGDILYGSAKENDSARPSNPYSASKAGADLLVLSYWRTYKTPVIIIRSTNNFGPYQYPEKLIPLFITNALENKQLPLYGEGKNIRNWIYVKDNCEAIELILKNGRTGEIYNVGGASEISNIEITKMILELLGKPETLITFVKDRPGHDQRYSLDSAKVKSEFNWSAKFDFKTALAETVKWYQENSSWWQKIKEENQEYQEFYQKHYQNSGRKH